MSITVISKTKDLRTGTNVIYCHADIETYLNIIGENFDEFEIQRKRVQHKAYGRMKQDIMAGTLLPTITLAVKKDNIPAILEDIQNNSRIEELLKTTGSVNILDGLQRTHILSDIRKEGHDFPEDQKILLEFWLEGNVNNLIYRIIVLNSGQKPMSMRHQIELLFSTTKENLKEKIPEIEIITERDEARRTKPGKYPLERLAISYYAYISKSTEIDKENIIAQKLIEENILEGGEEALGEKFQKYTNYLKKYYELDCEIYKTYGTDACTWFGSENVMISFFSAISDFSINDEREERVNKALNSLVGRLRQGKIEDDVIGYNNYQKSVQGLNSRKTNVGYATRKLLSTVFKEFYREEGEKSLSELWATEAI